MFGYPSFPMRRGIGRMVTGTFVLCFLAAILPPATGQQTRKAPPANSASSPRVRFATFNVALFREKAGQLAAELQTGDSSAVARIAEVIQRVGPDVILLNEIDYDEKGMVVGALCRNYLAVSQNGQTAIQYPHVYFAAVNTGVDSTEDLNKDGKKGTPDDAFGFGVYPGQYGMAVLSKYPIGDSVRTFQKFLWRDMPGAMWPIDPKTEKDFYSEEVKKIFRLSSKSHWDVPIQIGNRTVHLIAAHPTPPVFDGAEDRNGRRNHDEIRLIADYLSGAEYIYDDQGRKGGLAAESAFIVAGDLNADPVDGDSRLAAMRQLIDHPLVNGTVAPQSEGAKEAAARSGGANDRHRGDPAADTGDFNDSSVGNLRLDYVLPSKNLKVTGGGVFWPKADEATAPLASASDHHLVWIDVEF